MIRKLKKNEMTEALELVHKVFMEFEAPEYEDAGIQEFKQFLNNDVEISELHVYGEWEQDRLRGIIAMRNHHISLLFVKKEYHNLGIAKALFKFIMKEHHEIITVNSSPYAVNVYKKMGFIATDSQQIKNGIKYTPMIYKPTETMRNKNKVEALFADWQDSLILSCLQGYMGTLTVDHETNPESAMIDGGDFCFLAGKPSIKILERIMGNKILTPQDKDWETLIERYFGDRIHKFQRYAIKKEPDVFDQNKLQEFVDALDETYELRIFNQELFEMAKRKAWSVDLVTNFQSIEDYQGQGIGVGILHQGELVSAAAPYGIYRGGMEIEIDTNPEYRQKGLATVCGAKLILECLQHNLYPSWDAHDLRSVALAEKLGYHFSHPYTVYELSAK